MGAQNGMKQGYLPTTQGYMAPGMLYPVEIAGGRPSSKATSWWGNPAGGNPIPGQPGRYTSKATTQESSDGVGTGGTGGTATGTTGTKNGQGTARQDNWGATSADGGNISNETGPVTVGGDGDVVGSGPGSDAIDYNTTGGWDWGDGEPPWTEPEYPTIPDNTWNSNLGDLMNYYATNGYGDNPFANAIGSMALNYAQNGFGEGGWNAVFGGTNPNQYNRATSQGYTPSTYSAAQLGSGPWLGSGNISLDNILNFIAEGGRPVNTSEAWAAARQQGEDTLTDALRSAAERFSSGHTRFSSGSAVQQQEVARKAGNDLAATRLNMELQAQEAARQRLVNAMGMELQGRTSMMNSEDLSRARALQAALSNMEAQNMASQFNATAGNQASQFGANAANQASLFNAGAGNDWQRALLEARLNYTNSDANARIQSLGLANNLLNNDMNNRLQALGLGSQYSLGLGQQMLQNSQEQYDNQMNLAQLLSAFGNSMQTTSQSALDNIYRATYGLLPYALQWANSYPPGGMTQPSQGKGLGGMIGGGLGALATIMTGGAAAPAMGLGLIG